MNEDAYGFQRQAVQGGAGVVIAGAQAKKKTQPAKAPEAKQQLVAPAVAIVIPFTDTASRVRYLEAVRDYLRNQEALVEAALANERGMA